MTTAEIIAIGSELLSPFRQDTNSLFLTQTLEERGIRVIAKSIIGDDLAHLVRAFEIASSRADILICSGGLGPTVDDLTKEALAKFLDIPMNLDNNVLEGIENRFRSRGYKMPLTNKKQALIPEGAEVLENPNGTAPGIFIEKNGKKFFLLPGPPFELEPMWLNFGIRHIPSQHKYIRRIFQVAMMAESAVDQMLNPVVSRLTGVQYTILAAASQIEIHFLAAETSGDEIESACRETRAILGNKIYAEGITKLEDVVGQLLIRNKKTVSAAESCTGGLLSSRLTDVSGSSDYFQCSVIVYSNETKAKILGISNELIEQHGAVSETVATRMAENVRKNYGSDFGIGITGIAGPTGGSVEKPVGTVFVAVSDNARTICKKYAFLGTRDKVKFSSTQAALNILRLLLIGDEP